MKLFRNIVGILTISLILIGLQGNLSAQDESQGNWKFKILPSRGFHACYQPKKGTGKYSFVWTFSYGQYQAVEEVVETFEETLEIDPTESQCSKYSVNQFSGGRCYYLSASIRLKDESVAEGGWNICTGPMSFKSERVRNG